MNTIAPITNHHRKLHIAMPGDPVWQEKFWNEVVIPLGLEPFATRVLQVNFFRDDMLPRHLLKQYSDSDIFERQAQLARTTLRDQWDGPPHELVYGDFEPEYAPGGPQANWQRRKTYDGYDELDAQLLPIIRDAIRSEIDLPYALYNAPMMPSAGVWDDRLAAHSALSYQPIAQGDDWLWQGLYPSSDPVGNDPDHPWIGPRIASRVITGDKLKRIIAPGKPVIGALFFRHFQNNVAYQRRVLHWYNATGSDELIVWVKCGHERDARFDQFMFDEYKSQWSASADDLLRWLHREPVESDAGRPQGVE